MSVVIMLSLASPAAARDASAGANEAVLSMTSSSSDQHGHFFFYLAPLAARRSGSFTPGEPLMHFGGGGEATITKRVGIGTDFGGVPKATSAGAAGVISINAYLHGLDVGGRHVDPYFTVGYSGVFFDRNHRTGGPNVGVGLNWPLQDEFGWTVELRQNYGTSYREIRFGLVIWQ